MPPEASVAGTVLVPSHMVPSQRLLRPPVVTAVGAGCTVGRPTPEAAPRGRAGRPSPRPLSCRGGGRAADASCSARLCHRTGPRPRPAAIAPGAECRNADAAEPVVDKLMLDSLGPLTCATWRLTTEHSGLWSDPVCWGVRRAFTTTFPAIAIQQWRGFSYKIS